MYKTRAEEKYFQKKFLESENSMKIFILTGPALYVLFAVADYIKYPDYALEFFYIRVAIALIMLISYFTVRNYTCFFKNQINFIFLTVLATSGIACMIQRSNDPLSSYYIGITLVSVFSLTMGSYTKKLFTIALFASYLPYIFISIINYKNYMLYWEEYSIYWIFNIGFAVAISTSKISRERDIQDIIQAEINLEDEIREREKIINQNRVEISNLKTKELELLQKTFQFDLAQKVSHDIRSPISTLNIISSKIDNIEFKELHKNVVEQINNISNNLLNYSQRSHELFNKKSKESYINLIKLAQLIETEYQFKSQDYKRQINFIIKISKIENYELAADMATSLYSIINNLIQNSIEATSDLTGEIHIEIYCKNDCDCLIEISDNGCGIPDHVLKKLRKERISYGKENSPTSSGSGIAIYHASNFIHDHNGYFEVESKLDVGTRIKIMLPQSFFQHNKS